MASQGTPENTEAEQALLGSILISPLTITLIAAKLKPEDFFDQTNGEIYRAMLALHDNDKSPEVINLTNYLKNEDLLEKFGGVEYLDSMAQLAAITTVDAENYAQIIIENRELRDLLEAGKEISRIANENKNDPEKAKQLAETVLYHAIQSSGKGGFEHISSSLTKLYDSLSNIDEDSDTVGLAYGYELLDRQLSGMQKADMIIVAARPSMGKSALAFNIALHAARKNAPVGIFSIEMSEVQCAQRFIAMDARVDSRKLLDGKMTDEEYYRVASSVGMLSEYPIYIDSSASLSIAEMRAKAKRLHAEKGIELFIIDYLQLMSDEKIGQNRYQEVSAVSRGIKQTARDLDVPVMALAQLNRSPEGRADHLPILSDLRETGQIEQDADVIIFMHREGKMDTACETPNMVDIVVGKNRMGWTGRTSLYYEDEYTTFVETVLVERG